MSYAREYAKPRRAGRGFAKACLQWIALAFYRVGTASANARQPILPYALDGACAGVALLWGGAR